MSLSLWFGIKQEYRVIWEWIRCVPVSTIQERSPFCIRLPPAFHLLYVLPNSCSTSRYDGVRLWVSLIDVSTSGEAGREKGVRFEVDRTEGVLVRLYEEVR
jgi:hypothetical protein